MNNHLRFVTSGNRFIREVLVQYCNDMERFLASKGGIRLIGVRNSGVTVYTVIKNPDKPNPLL